MDLLLEREIFTSTQPNCREVSGGRAEAQSFPQQRGIQLI
jgi:hypothetical protein